MLEAIDNKQADMTSVTTNLTDAELKQLNSLLDNLRSPQ